MGQGFIRVKPLLKQRCAENLSVFCTELAEGLEATNPTRATADMPVDSVHLKQMIGLSVEPKHEEADSQGFFPPIGVSPTGLHNVRIYPFFRTTDLKHGLCFRG